MEQIRMSMRQQQPGDYPSYDWLAYFHTRKILLDTSIEQKALSVEDIVVFAFGPNMRATAARDPEAPQNRVSTVFGNSSY